MDSKRKKRAPATRGASRGGTKTAAKRPAARKSGTQRSGSAQSHAVVYTPAAPFSRGRLVLRLATVVAVVLALTFGISIFFKVETITVSGAEKYDAWTVKEASGIEIGDNLLTFGEAKAAGKIRTALPYVDTVRIGIKLPDTVNIEIVELDVVYAIRDSAEQWWLITSDGRVVDKADGATAMDYTKVEGVKLQSPVSGQRAVAYEPPAVSTTEETLVTVPVTITAADRLSTALSILQYMEERGIIGKAASVDVADMGDLVLWYGQQYQVKLGDTTQLAYKIECMDAAINGDNGLKEYDSGVLDITFTLKTDQVIYDAFE